MSSNNPIQLILICITAGWVQFANFLYKVIKCASSRLMAEQDARNLNLWLASKHPPFAALAEGMQLFVQLATTKRGLAAALRSGEPGFDALPARREQRLRPAFQALFQTATAAGAVRRDVGADEFLNAAASLCMSAHNGRSDYVQRMVALPVDGLRHQPVLPSSTRRSGVLSR